MSAVEIRLADSGDAKALREFLCSAVDSQYGSLADRYVEAAFSEDFRKPHFVLALQNDSIIGSAAFSEELFTVQVWGISWVYVRIDKQRQGVGARLVQACINHVARLCAQPATIILNTFPGKTGLYERCGFTKAGTDHEGGWFMMKILNPLDFLNGRD